MPTALITGVTGQDGSFLAEQLVEAGWRVVGLHRRSASPNLWRLDALRGRITLMEADLLDQGSLCEALRATRPDHVYHLAAQSFVPTSWRQPLLTGEVTALGTARMLEALRLVWPEARFYQASSSEMFGLAAQTPQTEETPFHPRSPYGVAKVYAHHLTINYRESYGLFAVSGVLFNHESERRGEEFVTRKIAMGAARAAAGDREPLRLGALEVRRDWGFAGDYTRAIHAMLCQDQPTDYIISSGSSHRVRDFAALAYAAVGLDWRNHVVEDPALLRPAEIPELRGDPARAMAGLGWRPSLDFAGLVERMVRAEVDRLAQGRCHTSW